jgi:alkyl hydroperoxide reductase subunit F
MYAIRKRINVLLVSRDLGGKTNYKLGLPWIKDYQVIHGLEVVNKFRSELEYLDFARHMEPVDEIKKDEGGFLVLTRGGGELKTKAVIVATGAKQLRLKIPGEKEYMMRGLCYSALSYAPLFIDRTVVVIGDGDLAMRSTAELATIAEQVYLVSKSNRELASPLGEKLTAADNVTILDGHEVVEVKGDDFARSVMVQNPDGKISAIEADGTFIEMALIPNSQMIADMVDLDDQGRIIVDCGNHTNVPGIFAAFDVTSGFAEQVLIAVGEGAKASLSAYEYLLPKL